MFLHVKHSPRTTVLILCSAITALGMPFFNGVSCSWSSSVASDDHHADEMLHQMLLAMNTLESTLRKSASHGELSDAVARIQMLSASIARPFASPLARSLLVFVFIVQAFRVPMYKSRKTWCAHKPEWIHQKMHLMRRALLLASAPWEPEVYNDTHCMMGVLSPLNHRVSQLPDFVLLRDVKEATVNSLEGVFVTPLT